MKWGVRFVYTDLNSPWSLTSQGTVSLEDAQRLHAAERFKDQNGYIPTELAERLEVAWNNLMAVDQDVEKYRIQTNQGEV